MEGLSFHWCREGKAYLDTYLVTLAKTNVLKIQSVTEEHFGQYKCEIKKGGILYLTIHSFLMRGQCKGESNFFTHQITVGSMCTHL